MRKDEIKRRKAKKVKKVRRMDDFSVGDKVNWVRVVIRGRTITITKLKGRVCEITDGVARCRRGKAGKVDYFLPLNVLLRDDSNMDPLREIVRLTAEKYKEKYQE